MYTNKSKWLKNPVFEEFRFPLSKTNLDIITRAGQTMRFAEGVSQYRNVGLASNQIGSYKRFFVMEKVYQYPDGSFYKKDSDDIVYCMNPAIIDSSSEKNDFWENCVSDPSIQAYVNRSEKIVVKFFDRNGARIIEELEGMNARVFQHEYDHLNGRLMVDLAQKVRVYDEWPEYKKILREKQKKMVKGSGSRRLSNRRPSKFSFLPK